MDERERDIELDRRGGLKSLGAHVARLAAPLARRRGTATARLAAEWSTIVGPEIARCSLPERLVGGTGGGARPPAGPSRPVSGGTKAGQVTAGGAKRGGTLRLRVEGPLALELQHLEPQLIERINAYFGYAAVSRLQLVQGPLPHRPAPAPPPARSLDPARARALRDGVQHVADERLRRSLERLGRAVLGRR